MIEYIWKTVSLVYHKICCSSDLFINKWYVNLKMTAEISSYQEMKNIREWYNKVIHSLTKIKNYEKWITKWELIIQHAQKQDIEATLNSVKWIQDFFNTIRHLISEWVSFYQIISRKQIDNNILIFHKVVNEFQTMTTDQAKDSKLSL